MSEEHPPCQCEAPTADCPRYGWMLGRNHQVCQGVNVTPAKRGKFLDLYAASRGQAPQMPGLLARAGNFAAAALRHAADGLARLGEEDYRRRLEVCLSCDLLRPKDRVCQHPACGCYVEQKARLRSEDCPLSRWPELPMAPAPAPPPGCAPCAARKSQPPT